MFNEKGRSGVHVNIINSVFFNKNFFKKMHLRKTCIPANNCAFGRKKRVFGRRYMNLDEKSVHSGEKNVHLGE